LRVLDVEVVHTHFGRIPKDKGHRPSRLSITSLGCIPSISIAVNTPGPMSVDFDIIPGNDKTCCVILERDGIGIISPVVKVIGKLYKTELVKYFAVGSIIGSLVRSILLAIQSPHF
jgi:hypothetical protein